MERKSYNCREWGLIALATVASLALSRMCEAQVPNPQPAAATTPATLVTKPRSAAAVTQAPARDAALAKTSHGQLANGYASDQSPPAYPSTQPNYPPAPTAPTAPQTYAPYVPVYSQQYAPVMQPMAAPPAYYYPQPAPVAPPNYFMPSAAPPPAPMAPQPVAYAPMAPQPVAYAPVAPQPVAYAPMAPQPMAYAPVAPQPVAGAAAGAMLTNQTVAVPTSRSTTRVRVRGPGMINAGLARFGERLMTLGRTRIQTVQETELEAPTAQPTGGLATISTSAASPVAPIAPTAPTAPTAPEAPSPTPQDQQCQKSSIINYLFHK
jgi:hypothetical protein